MEVEDGSANMEVEDDDARLRAEVLAYMKANRVTRRHLGASTEVDLGRADETIPRVPPDWALRALLQQAEQLRLCL